MDFQDIESWAQWFKYCGQQDNAVTYVYVASRPVPRLRGQSDILYIGETENAINVRYKQETQTNNTGKNTQNTNIRTTHVFGQIPQEGISVTCYFTKHKFLPLRQGNAQSFALMLKTWDKRAYTKMGNYSNPTIEKYLLVSYADQHLELPPLNNRF